MILKHGRKVEVKTERPDPGKMFDDAVAFTSAIIPDSTKIGYQKLAVSKEPTMSMLKEIPRRLNLVDPELRKIFRGLVSGEFRWPLYLWGSVGTGKTLAALCLCDHIPDSRYLTVEALADAVVSQDTTEWRNLLVSRLVVMDELGARQKDSDLHYKAIQKLADIRERRRRVAVYVSNLSAEQLAALYDDRIASRLSCGTVWQLKGDDRRPEE